MGLVVAISDGPKESLPPGLGVAVFDGPEEPSPPEAVNARRADFLGGNGSVGNRLRGGMFRRLEAK